MEKKHNDKKTLIFAVAGYNLAETGRMLRIAGSAKEQFNIVFMSYGGRFESLIEEAGFMLSKAQPRLTAKKLDRLKVILRGDTLNTVGYLSLKELQPRVENELKLFKEIRPAAVLTGWCLSVTISARVAGVPFINVLHSTTIQEYYQEGLQTWPDLLDFSFLKRLFTEAKLNKRMNRRVLSTDWPAKPYNIIGKQYGLKPFKNFIELLEGDYTLLADIPQWVNLPRLRPNFHYVGPLVTKLNHGIPEEIVQMPKDRPIVYFAMGSSGKPRIIAQIISGFKDKPYRVIAPVKTHLEAMDVAIPDNVIVTDFIPAHKVNPLADIAVIHGGQNTVMNACLSATPMVGVGMHPEQEANLESCVRKGFAIRLNKKRVNAAQVLDAIDRLLQDKKAKQEIEKFQKQLMEWDGPANAARFLSETVGK